MIHLFARPGSGSLAVEALLAELQQPYTREDVPQNAVPASYLAINPRGEVPALALGDDRVMTESAAIIIYLADLAPEKHLAPALDSPARTDYLRWIVYFASAVYMADLRYFYPERYSTKPGAAEGIKTSAEQHMARDFAIFARWLGDKRFILGEDFSAADIYAAMLLGWAPDIEALFAQHPNLQAYYARVTARPKIAPVWRRNEMP